MSHEPEPLRDLAVRAARQVGAWIRAERPAGRVEAATKSSPTDPVTRFDTGAEQRLREVLLGERPDDGMLGEEGADDVGTSGVVWVVDPIDGTVNFVYDHPHYAVSVAAQVGDRVLAGAVVDVATGLTYSAARGLGAWCHDGPDDGRRRLRVPDPPPLAQALVSTGFGYEPDLRRTQAAAVAALLPQVRDIRRVGSAALDLCGVAAGHVDAHLEGGLNVWDVAAGSLVATEAAAEASEVEGSPMPRRTVLVATRPLHDELVEVARACGF